MTILTGYFADFKDGPKVLFWGDASAMRELAGLLRASTIGSQPLALGSFVRATDGRSVLIRMVPNAEGMVPVGNYFEWRLDMATANIFAELVDVLAEANSSGHQYLECASGIAVIASVGEYPPTLKPE